MKEPPCPRALGAGVAELALGGVISSPSTALSSHLSLLTLTSHLSLLTSHLSLLTSHFSPCYGFTVTVPTMLG